MTLLELVVTMLVLSLVTSIGVVGFRAVTDRQDKNQALGNLFTVRDAQRRYASVNDSFTSTPSNLRALPATLTVSDAPSLTRNSVSMAVGSKGTLALATLSDFGCITLQVPPLSGPLARQAELQGTLPINVLCDARSALPAGEYRQTPGPPSDAVILADSGSLSGSSQQLINSGSLSDFANLVLGSSDTADSSDPTVLSYDGEQYLYVPSQTGNSVVTDDSVSVSPTGDADFRACVSPNSWSSQQVLIQKSGSYVVSLTPSGALRLSLTSGGLARTFTSPSNVSFSATQRGCVRALLDSNNGSGSASVSFFSSPSGVSWRALGSAVTSSPALSIDDTAAPLTLFPSDDGFVGRAHTATILDSGQVLSSFDARECSQQVCVSSSGESYTVVRSLTGLRNTLVERDVVLFDGLDDYLSIAHSSTLNIGVSESMTVVAAVRVHSLSATQCPVVSKRETESPSVSGAGFAGWVLSIDPASRISSAVYDGSSLRSASSTSSVTPSDPLAAVLIRNGTSSQTGAQLDGSRSVVSDGALASGSSNAVAVTVGKLGSLHCSFEMYGIAVYKRELSVSEVSSVYQALLN